MSPPHSTEGCAVTLVCPKLGNCEYLCGHFSWEPSSPGGREDGALRRPTKRRTTAGHHRADLRLMVRRRKKVAAASHFQPRTPAPFYARALLPPPARTQQVVAARSGCCLSLDLTEQAPPTEEHRWLRKQNRRFERKGGGSLPRDLSSCRSELKAVEHLNAELHEHSAAGPQTNITSRPGSWRTLRVADAILLSTTRSIPP